MAKNGGWEQGLQGTQEADNLKASPWGGEEFRKQTDYIYI